MIAQSAEYRKIVYFVEIEPNAQPMLSVKKALTLLLVFCPFSAFPQGQDAIQLTVSQTATFAAKDYQPLWIESLQFGSISDRQVDLSTQVYFRNRHFLPKKNVESGENPGDRQDQIYLSYGIHVVNNNHFGSTFAREAFVKAGKGNWEIRGGRIAELIGEVDPLLSSGSFAVSGNAIPIPKIGAAVTNYTNVPFTNGFLQFKGQYSHGWFGNFHSVKNAYLHEKVIYVKAGKKNLNLYVGLAHFVQWGGIHDRGPMPSRFKDYLRIIVGAPGDPNDPVYYQGVVDVDNAVGNHMFNSDIGLKWQSDHSVMKLYTQTIFSKGRGDSANVARRDDLIGLNMLGRDRMIGLSWEGRPSSLIEKVTLEGIFTTDQGGPIIFTGRFNYYNNATYATGWVYQDQLIGTPLFLSQRQVAAYGMDPRGVGGWNVVSNRIVGYHGGLKGTLGKKTGYRTLLTHARHYGNYYNDAYFTPAKKQTNVLLEITQQVRSGLSISAAMGIDQGDLSTNQGGRIVVEWRIR